VTHSTDLQPTLLVALILRHARVGTRSAGGVVRGAEADQP